MSILKRKPRPQGESHPVRNTLTALGGLGAVIAFPIWLFATFASAGDIVKLQNTLEAQGRDTKKELEINRLNAEVGLLQLRKGSLSDKVYDLGARKSVSHSDAAILERYRTELGSVSTEIAVKQQLIDELKAKR